MLILSRKIDQQIKIGDDISITIIEVRGDQVKIGVEAPRDVKVFRQEVFNAIKNENAAASNVNSEKIGSLSSMFKNEKV